MRRGFTLVEILIGLAVTGVFFLALAALQDLLMKNDRKNQELVELDLYEIERRVEFSFLESLTANIAASGDGELEKCFNDICVPCDAPEWRPISWANIPVRMVSVGSYPNVKRFNDGGAFTVPGWRGCEPKEMSGADLVESRATVLKYAPSCIGYARAQWRHAPGNVIEFLIELRIVSGATRADRKLRYEIPRRPNIARNCPYGIKDCPNHLGGGYGNGGCTAWRVSCAFAPVQVMRGMDLVTSEVDCGDPREGQ